MSNPLNIRPGDVTELTGRSWTSDIGGRRQEVTSVTTDSVYYIGGHHMTNPPEGYEHIVHYKHEDGDRYYCSINDTIYTYKNGEPFFTSRMTGDDQKAQVPDWFLTSEKFKRLAPEPAKPKLSVKIAPAGADLNEDGQWMDITDAVVDADLSFTPGSEEPEAPATTKQWVNIPGYDAKDGEKVRVPGDSREPYTVLGNSVLIAPGVSVCVDHFEELEVLREVVQLPTQFGHYESMKQGTTYDLDENGWSELFDQERVPLTREEVEGAAPLTRILTADEADERKRHALTLQREQNEGKRANARARYDRYQEELMTIIRRRNEENIRLRELLEEAGIKW